MGNNSKPKVAISQFLCHSELMTFPIYPVNLNKIGLKTSEILRFPEMPRRKRRTRHDLIASNLEVFHPIFRR